MIQPANPFHDQQIATAQRTIDGLLKEREHYIRLTVCLARIVAMQGDVMMVDGHVAVPRADFDAVPKRWKLSCVQTTVKPEEDAEDAKDEEVIVVKIDQRPEANGVLAPKRPPLVMP